MKNKYVILAHLPYNSTTIYITKRENIQNQNACITICV